MPLSRSALTRRAAQESRKEGYLWKINKKKKRRVRKYFVLVGGSFTWTLKPTVRDRSPRGISSVHTAPHNGSASPSLCLN